MHPALHKSAGQIELLCSAVSSEVSAGLRLHWNVPEYLILLSSTYGYLCISAEERTLLGRSCLLHKQNSILSIMTAADHVSVFVLGYL